LKIADVTTHRKRCQETGVSGQNRGSGADPRRQSMRAAPTNVSAKNLTADKIVGGYPGDDAD
jgi:hypothetical protein